MKKVLSLVLVFLMVFAMAVPAFASDCYLEMTEKSAKKLGEEGQMLPGCTYYFDLYIYDEDIEVDKRDFKVEFELDKGSEKFVESYGIKDGEFYITVVDDRSLNVEKDFIGFEIGLQCRNNDWEDEGIYKGDEFFCGGGYDAGNDLYYVEVEADKEDAATYDGTDDNTTYTSDERGWVIYDCGSIDILMRMYPSRTITFGTDTSEIAAVKKLSTGGKLEFLTFKFQPKITGTATFIVDEDYDYVYSFDGTKLTRLDVKEDKDNYTNSWEMTDVTLGTFVLSTTSLSGTAEQQPAPEATEPAAPAEPAPAPETPAEPEPEAPVEEPVEEPEEDVSADITPEPEPEVEPVPETSVEETEPEEEQKSSAGLPVLLLILAAAIVVAILIALLVARSGKKSRR